MLYNPFTFSFIVNRNRMELLFGFYPVVEEGDYSLLATLALEERLTFERRRRTIMVLTLGALTP